MKKPTFWEKALAFVMTAAGTAAAIWLSTHAISTGLGLLGSC
jgi:hypothetical protein